MDVPKRKPNRLESYDYSLPGGYFITICTKNRQYLLWDNVGASIARPQEASLSQLGEFVRETIGEISVHYPAVQVDHYAIMPNHVHLLLQILTDDDGRPMVAPTISTIVQQLKGAVTKKAGRSIWQASFHDHVVRGEKDYLEIWQYIQNNPAKWKEDALFSAQ